MLVLLALTVLLAVGVGWLWTKTGRNRGLVEQEHVRPRRTPPEKE